jgi:hypothetical protein
MRSSTFCRFLLIVLAAVLVGMAGISAAQQPVSSFTVVLLPDTQFYAESYPDTYIAQTEWIKSRAQADNVKFVIHLGDLVQNAEAEREWKVADRAHRVLDGVVPYSVLPGNHDRSLVDGVRTPDAPLYDKYFPVSRFSDRPWYGGHEGDRNANNYCFFETAGLKFMVLSLEFRPSDGTLEWAGGVLDSHQDRRVILATHFYMQTGGRDGSSGQRIWNKLVLKHPNIFMVLSGHVSGVAHQTSTNDAGNKVHEILCDYQNLPHGGDGWLQYLRFTPSENMISVAAFSPLLDAYNDHPEHTYTLEYDMSAAP